MILSYAVLIMEGPWDDTLPRYKRRFREHQSWEIPQIQRLRPGLLPNRHSLSSRTLAAKKAELFGGYPIIQEYEFNEEFLQNGELKVLKFDNPCKEWAEFIFKNRNRDLNFSHDYDVVIGPIANDGVAYLLGRYEEGTLTIDDLSRELTYKELNSQFFFGTEKSLNYLKRLW